MTNGQEPKDKAQKSERFSGLTGGLILILLGVLFLLATHHYIEWYDWWAYFLLGLGAILILDAILRGTGKAVTPLHTGKLVAGSILMVIGASHIFGLSSWWPLILVIVGLFMIITSFRKPA